VLKAEGQRVEDQFLVRQILSGNTSAFRFVVLRYQKPIFRYLRSFGIAETQVEEVAQDVFVKTFRNLSTYDREKSQFNTWLFVIAKNSALNVISKHSVKNEILLIEEPELVDESTPLSTLEKTVLKRNLDQSIKQLPLQFRNVITLFHFNEMSLEEISEVEQCNIGTVKSRLHRGKTMLRDIILKNYGTESI
jgi:RNA polymerase sigma factor (sigma-70 family)